VNQIDPAIIAKKPTTSVAGFFVFVTFREEAPWPGLPRADAG